MKLGIQRGQSRLHSGPNRTSSLAQEGLVYENRLDIPDVIEFKVMFDNLPRISFLREIIHILSRLSLAV